MVTKTLFGIENKVETSIKRLKYFEPPKGYYLAFSGGKDSIVIKHLAKRAGVKFDAHYNVTTIDPPDLIYFIRREHPDVIWEHPAKPLLIRMLEKGFPPTRRQRWCCQDYKEANGGGRLIVTGIRKAESARRRRRQMVEQCYTDHSKRYLHPILDWTDEDVWQYIREHELPYCSLYDEGWKRIGCLFCPMAGKHRLVEAKRYPRYVSMFIEAFERLYAERKASDKPDFRNWANGEEFFWWWLKEDRKRAEPDQLMMFE